MTWLEFGNITTENWTNCESSVFIARSVSTYPDQPTEQRRVPVHLPRASLRWLPVRSHRPPPSCDQLHWLKQTHPTQSAPTQKGGYFTHFMQIQTKNVVAGIFLLTSLTVSGWNPPEFDRVDKLLTVLRKCYLSMALKSVFTLSLSMGSKCQIVLKDGL